MSNQGKTEVFDQKLQDLKDVLPDELLEDVSVFVVTFLILF